MRSITTGSAQSLTYTDYDPEGNLKQLIDSRNGETVNFTYDHLDRLDHAWSVLFDESFAYTNIGTFQTRTNFSYSYPSAGSARPHAPTSVNGNAYTHDSNGNLTGAEGRTYNYDLENRLVAVLENGQTILSFTYDGDGVLRTMVQGGQTILYVSPDYRVNLATGEITVYYRFGGRAVAYGNNGGLKYLLSDHLSSTQGEVSASQSDVGERRYMPLGGLRAVSGIGDIADEEGFTSQRRIDAGNGNARRESYYYGARWYLPGVGIFTQPDTVVPDYKNPQALNRFSYVLNNPLRYSDPSGHQGISPLATPAPVPTPNPALTVTPLPAPTPGPTGTPVAAGPVAAQPTPTPAPAPTPWPASQTSAQGPSIDWMSAAVSALRRTDSKSPFALAWNSGNNALGLMFGELGGGQPRIDAHGNLLFESAQGLTGLVVKDLLGGGRENAVTIGDVILNSIAFDETTVRGAQWLAHEDAHVRQSAILGPAYLPTYFVLWVLSQGDHDAHLMEMMADEYSRRYWLEYLKKQGQTP